MNESTWKLALAGISAAALLTATAAEASGAGLTTESAAGCHETPHEIVGGRSQSLFFCADVEGAAGSYLRNTRTYLDRADYGPDPARWAGWIAEGPLGTGRTANGTVPGDHWWRVCTHEDGGPYYCTHWYHQ
ncbi:hypothetical protein VA596_21255 [Amycolatopsis sp., V23-08]|uniref:Secreted protein n=1 Tax=Amycolatopsis heterodermiae TaxID=3110235 RepID=A0ABU5RA04_9PSEU|nr:hypothetical protein [Amycolatopsis sp., V23-08]MEA5362076.1 hypothetical protein [Amycolatopsis sp., V23-08]